MFGYAISEAQTQRIQKLIEPLAGEIESRALLVCDSGGNIIAHVLEDEETNDTQTVAALAAGSFGATRELAGMIGEKRFSSVYHRGETFSIYLQSLAPDFLVVAILGLESTQGLAKFYIEKVSPQLEGILAEAVGQTPTQAGATRSFELDEHAEVFGGSKPSADS